MRRGRCIAVIILALLLIISAIMIGIFVYRDLHTKHKSNSISSSSSSSTHETTSKHVTSGSSPDNDNDDDDDNDNDDDDEKVFNDNDDVDVYEDDRTVTDGLLIIDVASPMMNDVVTPTASSSSSSITNNAVEIEYRELFEWEFNRFAIRHDNVTDPSDSSVTRAASLQDCIQQCNAATTCRALSYNGQECVQYPYQSCWLSDDVVNGTMRRSDDARNIVYMQRSLPLLPAVQYEIFHSMDLSNNAAALLQTRSISRQLSSGIVGGIGSRAALIGKYLGSVCAQQCSSTTRCIMFTGELEIIGMQSNSSEMTERVTCSLFHGDAMLQRAANFMLQPDHISLHVTGAMDSSSIYSHQCSQ